MRWHIVDVADGKEAFQASVELGNESSKAAYQLGEKLKNLSESVDVTAILDATRAADGKITIPADLIQEGMNLQIAGINDPKMKVLFAAPDEQSQSQGR